MNQRLALSLIHLIYSRGFYLLEMPEKPTWKYINTLKNTEKLEDSKTYLFVPVVENKTHEENYKNNEDRIYPVLKLTKEIYETAHFSHIVEPPLCRFTRLFIEKNFIVFSSLTEETCNPDSVDAIAFSFDDAYDKISTCFIGLTGKEIQTERLLFLATNLKDNSGTLKEYVN